MVDRWTNPTNASLRGDDARPLQQTFASLSTYLDKLDTAITAAAGAGVLSLIGTANQITVSAATGNITLSIPSSPTLAGTVTAGGFYAVGTTTLNRASATAWNAGANINLQIDGTTYSTIGVNSNYRVIFSGGLDVYGSIVVNQNQSGYYQYSTSNWSGDAGSGLGKLEYHSNRWYINSGSDSNAESWVFRRGATNVATIGSDGIIYSYGLRGNGNVGGTGSAAWFPSGLYSGTSGQAWIYGEKHFGYGNIEASGYHWSNGPTGLSYANSISCTGWFRASGQSGFYFESYGGGIWMTDSTWVRVYNSKNFYCDSELRANRYSGDGNAYYGSYGSISMSGMKNGYSGIDNADTASCMMMRNDLLGHYRNNNTWNFYVQYGTFYTSDERYKRNFAPLTLGLNFINKLKTVEFNRLTERPDDDAEALMPRIYYGFSAQQVKSALEEVGETRENCIWSVGGPDDDGATGGDRQYVSLEGLVPSIVKAIQEIDDRLSRMEQTLYEQSNPS